MVYEIVSKYHGVLLQKHSYNFYEMMVYRNKLLIPRRFKIKDRKLYILDGKKWKEEYLHSPEERDGLLRAYDDYLDSLLLGADQQ